MWNSNQIWCLYLLPILYFLVEIKPVRGLYCYVCSSDKLELCSTLHSLKELPGEVCPTSTSDCFTKVEDGITSRGCLTNTLAKSCDDSTCSRCKSDKCNAQIFPEDRLSCLHCQGESCVNQTNTIDVRYPCVKYVRDDECYSIFSYNGGKAFRGCMSDPNETGREYCINNIAQCKKCSKRACNSRSLEFEEKLSCVKCTPDKDNNCNKIDKNTTPIECDRTTVGYKNACYIYQNGSVSTRGCLYEAADVIFNECLDYYSGACFTCNQSDCNRAPINNDTFEFNSLYVTRTVKNPTFQGCSKLDCKPKLLGRLAKSIQYSDKPLECYQCNGNEDCDFMSSISTMKPKQCTISSKYDQCYTYIDQDQKMYRGCLSDASEPRLKCELDDKNQKGVCKVCSGSGCNNQPKHGKPQLSCLKCSDDKMCAFGQDPSDAVACVKDVTFGKEETCFTHAIRGTKKVERGCTLDIDSDVNSEPCQEENGCEKCIGSACNAKNGRYMMCVRCRDDRGENCATLPNVLEYISQCDHKSYPYEKRGCFTIKKEKNVTRGCVIDLSGEDYDNCRGDDSCTICTENSCNKRSKSSPKTSINIFLLGPSLILILYFI